MGEGLQNYFGGGGRAIVRTPDGISTVLSTHEPFPSPSAVHFPSIRRLLTQETLLSFLHKVLSRTCSRPMSRRCTLDSDLALVTDQIYHHLSMTS